MCWPVMLDHHWRIFLLLSPGFEFFEASAKENINVKQVFERLVDVICEKMNESLENGPVPSSGTTQLNDAPTKENGCSC